jgi:hypothetical protein
MTSIPRHVYRDLFEEKAMPVFEVSYHLGGSTQSGLHVIRDEVIADSLSCAIQAVCDFVDASDPAPLIVDRGLCAYILPKAHILTVKVAAKAGIGSAPETVIQEDTVLD